MRSLAIFFVACLCTHAWAAGEIAWPASPRTPAKLTEQWIEFDNMQMTTYMLTVENTKIEMPYLARFAVSTAEPKWNAVFVIAEQPAVRIGVSGFAKNEFLPSLTPESVLSYIAWLSSKGATAIVSTADGQLSEDLMIAGFKPEVVEYIQDKIKTREFFIEREGKVFVLSYQAPVKIFDSHADIARIIFSRIGFPSR